MRKEIDSIISNMQNVLDGQPWFGRPLYNILDEIHPAVVFKKPNEDAHSLIDLLYHMITWADFTLRRLSGEKESDPASADSMDWRLIDPLEHTWARAVGEIRSTHENIISILKSKNDEFLDEIVDYRHYNFRFLLNGLIQHDIYHLGQIAYVKKWLIPD